MNSEARFAALAEQPFRGRRNGGPTDTAFGVTGQLRDIIHRRELLGLLVRRDLKARYKDSALGFLWTLARPLAQLAIYYLVIGHFLGASKGIPDFGIYVFAGLTIYSLFTEIVVGGANSILINGGLVKKVYVPREIYPLASVGGALINFGIQFAVLTLGTIAFGVFPWHVELLYAIPSLLIVLLYGTAIALVLSVANVFLRDIGYLVEVILLFLMWGSPVLYGWKMVSGVTGSDSALLEVYADNPMTLAVLGFQKAFWLGGASDDANFPGQLLLRMVVACAIGLVLLVLCHWVFRRMQGNVAQEL